MSDTASDHQSATVYVVDRVASDPTTYHRYKSCGALTCSIRGADERPRAAVDDLALCEKCKKRTARVNSARRESRKGLARKLLDTDPDAIETRDPPLITDGGRRLPAYAERVDTDGTESVRCTVCGNEAPDLASLTHDCIYANDLVADGGQDVDQAQTDPEDDPFACSLCGGYLDESQRIRGGDYCESSQHDTEDYVRCETCGARHPRPRAFGVDVSQPGEYYPEFIYFCPTHAPNTDTGGDA